MLLETHDINLNNNSWSMVKTSYFEPFFALDLSHFSRMANYNSSYSLRCPSMLFLVFAFAMRAEYKGAAQ